MNKISNNVYCAMLEDLDIKSRLLPNPYHDYLYLVIRNFLDDFICKEIVDVISTFDTEGKKARVKSSFINGIIKSSIIEKYRKTKVYKLKEELHSLY